MRGAHDSLVASTSPPPKIIQQQVIVNQQIVVSDGDTPGADTPVAKCPAVENTKPTRKAKAKCSPKAARKAKAAPKAASKGKAGCKAKAKPKAANKRKAGCKAKAKPSPKGKARAKVKSQKRDEIARKMHSVSRQVYYVPKGLMPTVYNISNTRYPSNARNPLVLTKVYSAAWHTATSNKSQVASEARKKYLG